MCTPKEAHGRLHAGCAHGSPWLYSGNMCFSPGLEAAVHWGVCEEAAAPVPQGNMVLLQFDEALSVGMTDTLLLQLQEEERGFSLSPRPTSLHTTGRYNSYSFLA